MATVSDELMTMTESFFRDHDAETNAKIMAIHSEASRVKHSYAFELRDAYTTLTEAIQRAQKDKSYMTCDVRGKSIGIQPVSIQDWYHDNPGKMAAIESILRQLRLKNWQPNVKLSICEFPKFPCVQITCDFRQ